MINENILLIESNKLFLKKLQIQKDINRLDNFKYFISIHPGATKDKLMLENARLGLHDFKELIEKYYT